MIFMIFCIKCIFWSSGNDNNIIIIKNNYIIVILSALSGENCVKTIYT